MDLEQLTMLRLGVNALLEDQDIPEVHWNALVDAKRALGYIIIRDHGYDAFDRAERRDEEQTEALIAQRQH